MPSRQERRNERELSCSSFILKSTSSIIGPHALVSTCGIGEGSVGFGVSHSRFEAGDTVVPFVVE